jgi:hypothetical protein
VYAVIAHLDPPGGDDYDAPAYATVPDEEGHFSLEARIPGLKGQVEFRLTLMYADGTRAVTSFPAIMEEDGIKLPTLTERVLFSKVIAQWDNFDFEAARNELAKVREMAGADDEILKQISRWEDVLSGKPPVFKGNPSEIPAEETSISLVDCRPELAKSGWQGPCWDHLAPSQAGLDAYLNEGKAERFIMNHANGELVYDLGGKWNKLTMKVGVPAGKPGTIRFIVSGDGQKLFESEKLTSGESAQVDLSVKDLKSLKIEVNDNGDGNGGDWGVIVDPVLSR